MAMERSGISRQQMADEFEVDPQTITRWTHDVGARPKRIIVRNWAVMTGVDVDWLETGEATPDDGGDGDDGLELPRLDSNQQPSGYRPKRRDLHRLGALVADIAA